jgi:hypothetical protein
MWGALSDERTGLSFTNAPGPRQRSNFRVGSRGTRDHILLSQIRDFPSPPTTRRVTVEVFDPASTQERASVILGISLYSCGADHTENTVLPFLQRRVTTQLPSNEP